MLFKCPYFYVISRKLLGRLICASSNLCGFESINRTRSKDCLMFFSFFYPDNQVSVGGGEEGGVPH